MSTELVLQRDPYGLIQLALETGKDADQLGKLLDLQERWEKMRAAEAYAAALASFQAECPPIVKDRQVMNKDKTSERYRFAGFEDILPVVQPYLSKHKIAISFTAPVTEKMFHVVMRVQVGSHFEDKPYAGPMPDMAKIAGALYMTEPQAFGTVLSYYKRYAFTTGLNIQVVGEDNDASPHVQTINREQVMEINDLIFAIRESSKDFNFDRFLAWCQVKGLEEITVAAFPKVVAMLEQKLKG